MQGTLPRMLRCGPTKATRHRGEGSRGEIMVVMIGLQPGEQQCLDGDVSPERRLTLIAAFFLFIFQQLRRVKRPRRDPDVKT